MNGPARIQDISKIDEKEIRDRSHVPDTKSMKAEIRKVIEPVGAMDASHVPEGVIEKDI